MRTILIALAALFASETALAAGETNLPGARTSSVAEMLQRRQEHQLRQQLVKEGRLDEVRELDEAQVRRQQVQTKQSLTRLNSELAREGAIDATINGDGVVSYCPPAASVKSTLTKIKPESSTTNAGASSKSY